MQHILLGVLWAVCYVLALGYHLLLWSTGDVPSTTVALVYHVVVLTGYTALWFLLSSLFRYRHPVPGRVFWGMLLFGGLYVVLAYLAMQIPPAGIVGMAMDRDLPLAPSVPFKISLQALLKAGFAFVLLLRFRSLVLVKRTRSSQRNWNLMIGLMVVASLSGFMKSPREEVSLVQGLAIIPAVVLMVINAFRLSWIVSLSFRAKMATSAIAFLLLLLLLSLAGIDSGVEGFEAVPGATQALLYYSYPLAIFTGLAIYFGILYCTTAFLSLLFHLPTTSDFQRKAGEMAIMHSLSNLVGQV
ncbi:MAG: protein serine phosphatase, partial [Bacteroidetes bacterium]